MNTPTYRVHPTHEYIHHTKWNRTLANDYSTLSQSVQSLYMKMSMPLPANRDILVCDGATNNTIGANYTDKDAAAARGICQGCALGSAHQYPTNQHYVKSTVAHDPGQQFVVDAFTYHSVRSSVFIYAHLFTDLASRRVYPVFIKSKLVTDLIARMALLFHSHPEWKPNGSAVDRKIITQLNLQSTVTASAILSKPHPHVTNMLMVSLRDPEETLSRCYAWQHQQPVRSTVLARRNRVCLPQ